MALTDYKGPANSEAMFPTLVGERIVGVFQEKRAIWLVLESGAALVLTSLGGEMAPAFWAESAEAVQTVVARQRDRLRANIAALANLGTIEVTP